MVAFYDIVRIGYPNARRSCVRVEQRRRTSHIYDQVAFDCVLGFCGIVHKDSVAHRVINNVVLHAQVMDSVNSHCPVKGLVDCIVFNVRLVHCPNHVEIYRVSA